MSTIAAIRDAIGAALAPIGLEIHTYTRGTVNPPAAVILPAPGTFLEYHQTLDSAEGLLYHMRVVLLVAFADAETGTDALDAYLEPSGPQSVSAAIEADPTLGGAVSFAVPETAGRYGTLAYGGMDYLGCELIVAVGAP